MNGRQLFIKILLTIIISLTMQQPLSSGSGCSCLTITTIAPTICFYCDEPINNEADMAENAFNCPHNHGKLLHSSCLFNAIDENIHNHITDLIIQHRDQNNHEELYTKYFRCPICPDDIGPDTVSALLLLLYYVDKNDIDRVTYLLAHEAELDVTMPICNTTPIDKAEQDSELYNLLLKKHRNILLMS